MIALSIQRLRLAILLLVMSVTLVSCSSTPEPQPEPSKETIQQDSDRFFEKMKKEEAASPYQK